MAPKKRFSAFEDFPVENGAQKSQVQPGSLFEAPATEGHILNQPEVPEVERIERLKPSQMRPDRFQPRRLLPTALRPAFYSGSLDCYQAARQWLQLARTDSGVQAEVDRLLAMGGSFEEHGQIKPITGSWVETAKGEFIFQIETGERRFWAACLQYVLKGGRAEPLLRVEVVQQPTRMRQVLENRHAEPPSAVGQACEVASLILSELGIAPPAEGADEFDFFRQAREKRMPAGLWEKIMPVMQLTRPRMVQLLNVLALPTPLLDLADRHRLPERVLREVLGAPRDQWSHLLASAAQNQLTSEDVAGLTAELSSRPRPQTRAERRGAAPRDPATVAIQAMLRFNSAISSLDEDTQRAVLDELADEITGGQAELLSGLLDELARLMLHRQQSRGWKR